MNARKLRILLIDDRPLTQLETAHIEILKVPCGSSGGTQAPPGTIDMDPSLGTWAQHLRLWSDNLFPRPEPDLVLIDCRFEEDYQYVPTSDSLRDRDPRGLMHGAIYIARMFGRDRYHPFGFAVYSMDASGFRNDAYAQTFMGFLLAMRDSTLAEGQVGFVRGRKDRELVDTCAQELGRTISQNPATAWGPALAMYRQRLREVADLHAIIVDRDSWLKAMDCLNRKAHAEIDAGLGLGWRRFDGQPDRVELRSLFADQLEKDAWGPAASEAAHTWLESLLVLGDYLGEARQWVYQVLEEQQDPEGLPVPRGQDLHGNRLTGFFHACTGVVAWYENRSSELPRLSSSNLLLELGLSDKQLNRYFKPLLDLPWGKIVDLLDEGLSTGVWPLAGQWELHQVAREWATQVRNRTFPLAGTG